MFPVRALRCSTALLRRPSLARDARVSGLTGAKPFSSTPSQPESSKIMLEDPEGFGFIRHNARPPKPRKTGVTEIRGPYYSVMGKRYLQDIFDT
jgi:hypothetical protein